MSLLAALTGVARAQAESGDAAVDPGAEPEVAPAQPTPAQPAPAPSPPAPPAPALARPAVAQPAPYREARPAAAESTMSMDSPRSKANNWLIMPSLSYELGADLAFVTAAAQIPGPMGENNGREFAFTDVVLLSPHGRYSLAGKADLVAGIDILAKQPGYLDEPVFQGAFLGNRIAAGKKAAVWTRVAGGPMMYDQGFWGNIELAAQVKKRSHETMTFGGAVGTSFTMLFFDQETQETPWFAEIVARGEAMLHSPRNEIGLWIGTEFRFPVAEHPDRDRPDPLSGIFIDATTRVNFELGTVYSLIENIDLYVSLVFVDRGEVTDPNTTLPILGSGFDQRHITFGVIRRFTPRSERRHRYY